MNMNGIFTASSIKKTVWSGVLFFIAWGATKALDYFLDFTILSTLWGGVLFGIALLSQEIPTPLWCLLSLLVLALSLFLLFYFKNKALQATNFEIERLKNPPKKPPATPQLSDTEHSVLMTIAALLEKNQQPDDHDIMSQLNLTPLPTQAAIDVLASKYLIHTEYDANYYNYWELTPKGRIYALDPNNKKRT